MTTTIKAPVLRAMLKLKDETKPHLKGIGCKNGAIFTTDSGAILFVGHPGIGLTQRSFDPAHVPTGDVAVDLTALPMLDQYRFPCAIKVFRGPVTLGSAPFVDAKYLNIFISVLRALGDKDPGNIKQWDFMGRLTSSIGVAVIEKRINGFQVRMVVGGINQKEGEAEAI